MSRVRPWRIVGIALALAGAPISAVAGTPYGWSGAFGEKVVDTFFEPVAGGELRVVPAKVQRFREGIERKRRVLEQHFVNYETIEKGTSESKARSEAQERDTMIALDTIHDRLDEMEASSDSARAFAIAAEILTVEYATRSFTEPIGSVKIPVHLKNLFAEWRLPNWTNPRRADREASNLLNPETGEFYTPEELAALTRSGFDISKLDPPRETAFWRKRDDIASVDIVYDYLNGGDPVHEGIVSEFPPFDGAVFELDKPHMTQSKPKLDVYYLDDECRKRSRKKQKGCRQGIKLKFGMETHADPPANALLGALGFNIDVSMHLKNVRVNLGKNGLKDLERDWIGYFDRQRIHTYIPLESVLKPGPEGHGTDEQGDYVVFTQTVAELKPPELERIGLWPFSSGMAAHAREARGLFVFNAWIGNADMKDEENNKLILRRGPDGSRRMYLVQQDLGHSQGWVLPEFPNQFPWDLVEHHLAARLFGWMNRSIEFDYIDLQDAGLEDTTTYADGKWMARLIAQLTRKQIADAVSLGHWPGGIGPLYVEKLVNRRNQLVKAFHLTDEFALLPVDREITTADGSVVNGELVRNRWVEESSVAFDDYWLALFGPVGDWFLDRAAQGLQAAVAAVDVINPGNVRISGRLSLFPRFLVKLSREVILNPDPEGAFDQYIVFDQVEVGVRAGIGFVGSVEGTLLKRYALAYPVSTLREGITAGVGVINFLLPYDVHKGKLPEKYVLFREHAYKAGFRVSTDHSPFLSPLGVDGDQNWVWSQRSVIDRRGKTPIIWTDAPRFMERDAHMFLEAAVLQVPFLGGTSRNGRLSGRLWKVDPEKLDLRGDDDVPVFETAVRRADFRGIDAVLSGPAQQADVEFASREMWWNLLFANHRDRAMEQRVVLRDAQGKVLRQEKQVERRNRFNWSFLDNGETQEFRVIGTVDGAEGGDRRPEPMIVIRYAVDDLNAHSDEFDGYYQLLQGIGAGENYLATEFRATDWEVSGKPDGRWTRLLTTGTVQLHPEAVDRLVQVDPEGYWRLLARNLGMGERELARHRSLARASTSKDSLVARRSLAGRRLRALVRRSNKVLNLLTDAREAGSQTERLRRVVEAVYRSSFRSGSTFDPVILATLLEQCGMPELVESEQIGVHARVFKAFEDESNFPERRDVVGRLGADEFEEVDYRLFPLGGIELYNMLDWVSAIE